MTLAKGMAYPAFIVAAFATGIPLKLVEQGLYLAAAGLTAWLVGRLTRSIWLAGILFGCLALNPVLWTANLSRVIREGIYISLSFAVMVLAAAVLLQQSALSVKTRVAFLLMLGLAGGSFWLTREEGVWLAPALAFLFIVAGSVAARHSYRSAGLRGAISGIARIVGMAAIAAMVFVAMLGAVASMNYRQYGAFTTNELQSAPLRAAYGAVSRIHHDEWRRYIVFPKDARERAYSVSEAARELRPTLEGIVGENWRQMGCAQMRIEVCPGIPAGWFVWAFRDAVAAAGHYSSAREAFSFYRRLAAEINGACDDGQIACLPARNSMSPPFRWQFFTDALSKVPALGRLLIDPGEVGPLPSMGRQFVLDLFTDLVGPLAREPISYVVLLGSVAADKEFPTFVVRDRNSASSRFELRTMPQMDQAPAQGSRAIAFELTTDCLRPSCELVVRSGPNEQVRSIESLGTGSLVASPEFDVSIRHVFKRGRSTAFPVASEMRQDIMLRVMWAIAAFYAGALHVLVGLSAVGVVLALALWRSIPPPAGVLPLVLACGIAVATRVTLLAYIEVSSFPAANALYLSSASPFLLIFVVLGLYLGVRVCVAAGKARWRQQS